METSRWHILNIQRRLTVCAFTACFFVWSWGYYYKQAPYKQHMFITAMEYIEDIQAFFSSRGKK